MDQKTPAPQTWNRADLFSLSLVSTQFRDSNKPPDFRLSNMDGAEESLTEAFNAIAQRLQSPQFDVAPLARVVESSIQALMQVKIMLNKQQDRFEKGESKL